VFISSKTILKKRTSRPPVGQIACRIDLIENLSGSGFLSPCTEKGFHQNSRKLTTVWRLGAKINKPTLYGYPYETKRCFGRRGSAGLAAKTEVNINRMTNADATVGDHLVASGSPDYSASYQIGDVDLQYDRIGNINSLDRTSRNAGGGTYTTLQSFNYSYGLGTNRLNAATGLAGTTTRNYTYDANGNMLTDDFRNINATTYGRAAYPFYLDVDGDDVNYLYSVDDQRIYTKESNGSDSTKTYYLMDAMGKTVAIYTMDTVGNSWEYYIASAERECRLTPRVLQVPGTNELTTDPTRLTFEKGQASFYYYDHLGNTRLVCMPDSFVVDTTVQEILFVADYFPFGKTLREYSGTYEERFLTTQHERDRSTGLDYRGARYYDSDIARFLSLDPLARKYPSYSDYNYVMCNPIFFTDPNGKEAVNHTSGWDTDGHRQLADAFGNYTGVVIEYYEDDDKKRQSSKSAAGRRSSRFATREEDNSRAFESSTSEMVNENNSIEKVEAGSPVGWYSEISYEAIIGGGMTFAIGIVHDNYGNSKYYYDYGGGIGFNASVGLDAGTIYSTYGKPFHVDDFNGSSREFSASFTVLEYHRGNNDISTEKGFSWSGDSYYTVGGTFVNQKSLLIKTLDQLDIDVGVSYTWNTTTVY